MSVVRAFAARIVRPDHAAAAVTALAELPEDARAATQAATDPAAYVEAPAALYVYRQARDDVAYTGVVCEVATRAFVAGRVRGHEAVQPRRVESLVRHHATTDTPAALVALLHTAGPVYERAVADAGATEPLLDFAGPDGLRQTVWRVPDGPAADALASELSDADLYVADGHHRVAAALSAWSRAGEPADTGLLCVVHPLDGLRLSAFHRRVTGPLDPGALSALLRPGFTVEALPAAPATEPGSFGLYVDGGWSAVRRRSAGRDLDVEVLRAMVLEPLGRDVEIAPARTSVEELVRRCDADGGALFTLAPPPLATLTRLADADEVMAPKTTYFEPKPCSGIFLRP